MPTLLDLPTRILAAVCRELSFKDVLALRTASTRHLEAVAKVMDLTQDEIIGRFVSDPAALKNMLVREDTYVGGSAALAFFIRDGTVVPNALDLYTPLSCHAAVVSEVMKVHGARVMWRCEEGNDYGEDLFGRRLFGITYLATTKGLVMVHGSATRDPLAPIVRGWCTAVTNFFHPHSFGCGYPLLLFQRRALVGTSRRHKAARVRKYIQRGFEFRLASHMWPDLQHPRCVAEFWCCPVQARSFNDRGALVSRIRPLEGTLPQTTLKWRLDFRLCGQPCLQDEDDILRPWELCHPW
ncbi:hypothetical protein C8Q76DRAFT_802389 [Earliella scabrosa]|nr:hypothetical protein C8Q76DRAFT_802389 [Earliella scabrosa]